MFKFHTTDKEVVAIAQADVPALLDKALKSGKFFAIEWTRVDSGKNDRMLCAPIPNKVKAGFTGTRNVSPDVKALFSTDRQGVRSPRIDSIRVIAADRKLYVVTSNAR